MCGMKGVSAVQDMVGSDLSRLFGYNPLRGFSEQCATNTSFGLANRSNWKNHINGIC